jgi:hypothetical protein
LGAGNFALVCFQISFFLAHLTAIDDDVDEEEEDERKKMKRRTSSISGY